MPGSLIGISLVLMSGIPASAQEAGKVAFVNVNVVPMDTERVLIGQTVVVEGNTIIAVGPQEEVSVPAGAEVIDGDGGFLAPGLADMHAHLTADPSPDFMRMFLAEGVTTLRNLNALPEHLVWREEVLRGERIGPTIYTSGPVIAGPPDPSIVWAFRGVIVGGLLAIGLLLWIVLWVSRRLRGDREGARGLRRRLLPTGAGLAAAGAIIIWADLVPMNAFTSRQYPMAYVPNTVRRAREEVQRQADAGFDLVKVYDFLTTDEYLAVVDEAARQDIYVVGHQLDVLSIATSTGAGLREIVHVDEFMDPHMLGRPSRRTGFDGVELDLESVPESVTAAVANDILVVSNLVADENAYEYLETGPSYFERPEYANTRPETIEAWRGGRVVDWQDQQGWRRSVMQPFLVRVVQELHGAGVPLLIGTDVSIDGIVPSHIHRELELLVGAGLSPYEALSAATKNARVSVNRMGVDDAFGEVAVGSRADLVLLSANPLENVAATRRRLGVMSRGRWYTQSQLDLLVAELVSTY